MSEKVLTGVTTRDKLEVSKTRGEQMKSQPKYKVMASGNEWVVAGYMGIDDKGQRLWTTIRGPYPTASKASAMMMHQYKADVSAKRELITSK